VTQIGVLRRLLVSRHATPAATPKGVRAAGRRRREEYKKKSKKYWKIFMEMNLLTELCGFFRRGLFLSPWAI
ncbi:MAG: hypothetical protein FWG59_03710, partial [Betaproteobacteria bacterium]|nr:hypothetical protein [Betaproteobacteria bacterium]